MAVPTRVPHIHVSGESEDPIPPSLIAFLSEPSEDAQPPSKRRRLDPGSNERRPDLADSETPQDGTSHILANLSIDVSFAQGGDGLSTTPGGLPREERPLQGMMIFEHLHGDSTGHDSMELQVDLGAFGTYAINCHARFCGAASVIRNLLTPVSHRYGTSSGSKLFSFATTLRWAPQSSNSRTFRFNIQLSWCDLESAPRKSNNSVNATALSELLFASQPASTPWTFQDFYNSVHIPAKSGLEAEVSASLKVDGVACKLYPFQRRSVCWLLKREGVEPNLKPSVSSEICIPHPFTEVTGVDGHPLFVSQPTLQVTSKAEHVQDLMFRCSGGLLAEEMGLGKTVEMLSLVNMHQRRHSPHDMKVDGLIACSATIIISPVSIQQQWKSEIEMHSPHLQVMIYEGMKSIDTADAKEEQQLIKDMCEFDIILVSYTVLSREVHYAAEEPSRKMRHAKRYRKPKSPLVQIHWWRCILDECQMIEGGLSQAAQVAHQIPRRYSWAVSGTPMKKDATDLTHIIEFLRLEVVEAPVWWSWDLVKGSSSIQPYKPLLDRLFGQVALRHTKDQVNDELVLPPQKRLVMGMPFTAVEEQRYADMFQEMCDDCGLALDGAPLRADWDPEDDGTIQKMRTWLARLRQTVLHPEVGLRNRRALGRSEGPLRTVAEVLDVMIEQNETAVRLEERNLLISKLRRGQILEHARKPQEALDLWIAVLHDTKSSVEECRRELAKLTAQMSLAGEDIKTIDPLQEDEEDEKETGTFNLWRIRLRSALEVLHTATFFVANAYFQIKSNEEMTKPDSEEFKSLEKQETEMYEEAKMIRKELLSDSLERAGRFMDSVKARPETAVPEYAALTESGGLESRHITEKADDLCDILNEQREKIEAWRQAIKKALLTPLIDQEDEELQGDEYETSTKHQDEVYVYVEVLRALIADRHELLTGQHNALIDIEMRRNLEAARRDEGHSPPLMIRLLLERQDLKPKAFHGSFRNVVMELRSLRTSLETTRAWSKRTAVESEIVHLALTHLQSEGDKQTKTQNDLEKELELFMNTSNARLDFYRQLQSISDNVAPFEKEFEETEREQTLTQTLAAEDKVIERLQRLKSRARYLVHLTSENDSQAEPKHCVICREPIEIGVLTSCGHQFCKDCLQLWWNTHKTCPVCKKSLKQFDFHQISFKPQELSVQEESSVKQAEEEKAEAEARTQAPAGIYSGINRTTVTQIQQIELPGSYGTKIDTLARHLLHLRQADPGAKSIIFSQFSEFLVILGRAFKRFRIGFASVDDHGDRRGIRRRTKNSGKSATRLRESGIERFLKEPGVECFFLHARAQAAGLNLVNATHVFLCEPLINTALELQAIARVHRIGQHQPTAVYMYLVDGTVERAIYDISVRRRLAHAGQVAAAGKAGSGSANGTEGGTTSDSGGSTSGSGAAAAAQGTTAADDTATTSDTADTALANGDRNEDDADDDDAALEAANSAELQQAGLGRMLASGTANGELVPKSDVWECLFRARPPARTAADETRRAVAGFLAGDAAEERRGEQSRADERRVEIRSRGG